MGTTVFDLDAKIGLDTSGFDKGLEKSKTSFSSFGSFLSGAAKVGLAAITTATTAVTGALVKGASEVAAYGDSIDKMSQKMGLSAEAYQEWDAVMQHSGASITSVKAGMRTLAAAAEKGSAAFDRLGMSQEQVASMSQEELFSATITALQNVEDTTERTYLAGQLLGRGAVELGALLNTSAEDTQKMKDRVHELGGVMSDEAVKASAKFQDNLQDMKTAMSGLKRTITGDLLPGLNMLMEGFTSMLIGEEGGAEAFSKGFDNLVDKIGEIAPKAFNMLGQILPSVVTSLVDNIPKAVEVGVEFLGAIGQGFIDNADVLISSSKELINMFLNGMITATSEDSSDIIGILEEVANTLIEEAGIILDAGAQIISNLFNGMASKMPTLLSDAADWISQIAVKITDPANITKIVQGGMNFILSLGQGIIKALPKLIATIPVVVSNLLTALRDSFPSFIQTIVGLVTTIVEELPEIITELLNAIPEIITMVIDTIVAMLPVLIDGIIQLVTAIADNLPEIIQAIIDALPNIIQSVVDALITLVPALVQGAIQLTIAVMEHLPEIIAAVIQAIPQIIEAIITGFMPLSDRVVNLFSEIGEAISSWWSDKKQAIADGWNSFLTSAKEWFDQLPYNLGYALADMIVKFGEWLNDALDWVATEVPKIIDAVIDWFKKLPSRVWGWLVETIEKIGKWVVDTKDKIDKELPAVIDGIVKFFEELPGKAWDWGVDMINSFINGIASMAQAAWDSVEGFVQGIADRIGHSHPKTGPLAKDYEWMPDMMQLFAEGIDENAPIVNNAIERNFDFSDSITPPEVDYQQIYQNDSTSAMNQMVNLLQELVDSGLGVELSPEADGIFRVVEKENRRRTKATGYNTLAQAGG
jgi:phage-related protein